MQIGHGTRVYRQPGDLRPTKVLYDEAMDYGVRLEQEGFDFCWVSEHHFEDDQWNPSPLTMLANLAARTSTIGLGTNVVQTPYHHPIRLAEDVATIDILSSGRMSLAGGTGSAPHEFETFNLDEAERHGRTIETLKIVKGMYDNEVYDHHGKYFTFPNIRLTTRPMQRKLPIFMAAVGPKNMRAAGREGLGLTFQPAFAWHLDQYYEGLAEGGHDIKDVNLCTFGNMGLVVATQREADEIREKATKMAGEGVMAYNARRKTAGESLRIDKELDARGEDVGAKVVGPIGTPDQVLRGLEDKYRNSDITHVLHTGTWGPFGSSELWIKEVAPVLRTWGRAPVGTEVLPEKVRENKALRG